MSANTKIEWCDRTWNVTTGCTKVSEGCRNCYAERIAQRFWGERKFSDVQCHDERLNDPLHWKKPSRVFVDSMSDLFHPDVPDSFIANVFDLISYSWVSHHTFLILTKRASRMQKFWAENPGVIIPNLWLGVSVEDQKTADERIPYLLQTPAAKRFVSFEPALGEVDFDKREWLCKSWSEGKPTIGTYLDWVIMGGESGPGARPMDINWARSVKNQCVEAGVPFFFKQAVIDDKMVKMPALDGKVWKEYPE